MRMLYPIDFEGKGRQVLNGMNDIGEVVQRLHDYAILHSNHGGICMRHSCRAGRLEEDLRSRYDAWKAA